MNQLILSSIAVIIALLIFASVPDSSIENAKLRAYCDFKVMLGELVAKRQWNKARDLCLDNVDRSSIDEHSKAAILTDLAECRLSLAQYDSAIASAERANAILDRSTARLSDRLRVFAILARLYNSTNRHTGDEPAADQSASSDGARPRFD